MLTRKMLLAFLAAASLTALAPSVGTASEAKFVHGLRSVRQDASMAAATDISAARRRHHAYHSAAVRNAFGSIGRPVYDTPSYEVPSYGGGSAGFGYGVGDNSQNQTW